MRSLQRELIFATVRRVREVLIVTRDKRKKKNQTNNWATCGGNKAPEKAAWHSRRSWTNNDASPGGCLCDEAFLIGRTMVFQIIFFVSLDLCPDSLICIDIQERRREILNKSGRSKNWFRGGIINMRLWCFLVFCFFLFPTLNYHPCVLNMKYKKDGLL